MPNPLESRWKHFKNIFAKFTCPIMKENGESSINTELPTTEGLGC